MNTVYFKIKQEELISRIPSLFAYGEVNELGMYIVHKATDSDMGTYGKYVENISIENKVWSYRTLIDKYYNAELDDGIKSIVEKGIGLVEIAKECKELGIEAPTGVLVPDYIYLATAKSSYKKMKSLQRMCKYYQWLLDNNKISKGDKQHSDYCCKCEYYNNLGGDNMVAFLGKCVEKSVSVAQEMYDMCDNSLSFSTNIILTNTIDDLGVLTPYIEEYELGKEYYEKDIVFYDDNIYECTNANCGIWDNDTERLVFDDSSWRLIKPESFYNSQKYLETQSDSLLKSLRRSVSYVNLNGGQEVPSEDEDWLFYYRVGRIMNISVTQDELGNLVSYENGKYEAFGDVINKIVINTDNQTITFTYIIDVRLKPNPAGKTITETDEDLNTITRYSDFIYDDSDTLHGIKYTETYTYEKDGELDNIEDFDGYIKGERDAYDIYKKYAFKTSSITVNIDKNINGNNVSVPVIISSINYNLNYQHEYQNFNNNITLYRDEYLKGIAYRPTVNTDILIERGNTVSFEKHLKFAEVKTLKSMENYSNGSFFNMEEG
jgi:hypothetical protein